MGYGDGVALWGRGGGGYEKKGKGGDGGKRRRGLRLCVCMKKNKGGGLSREQRGWSAGYTVKEYDGGGQRLERMVSLRMKLSVRRCTLPLVWATLCFGTRVDVRSVVPA